ncbi:MAG: ABC transporter ATP-binding protein [Desulfobacteraceae bacterium]
MLKIESLKVEVGGQEILRNIDLHIPYGETHILFGPNGSGKTTLMMTIMGFSGYRVTRGRIVFKGEDITELPVYERVRRGIGVLYQRPPTINGLSTRRMVEICANGRKIDVDAISKKLKFEDFLERDVNENLSGGEIKRSELLQLTAQQPDLLLLDEPASGVDLESISLLGRNINSLLNRGIEKFPSCRQLHPLEKTKSGLVITHTGHILDYITADKGVVLYEGELRCSRNAREILKWIREYGYEECVGCSV